MTRRLPAVLAAAIALVLLAGVAGAVLRPGGGITLHARFASATGVYAGNNVDVLGLPVGRVTKVEPHGTYVVVSMRVPDSVRVPAGVTATIVPPSVISDRYVELSPVYRGGPTARDGAVIPLARTRSPVEYDDLIRSLDSLVDALGPTAGNPKGVVAQALHVAAQNLGGNGPAIRAAIANLADVSDTLAAGRGNLTAVIRNLDQLTRALADNDGLVSRFDHDLAAASTQLAGQSDDIATALHTLDTAVTTVADFVRTHRDTLTADVHGLADVTSSLLAHQRGLVEAVDVLPLGLTGISRAVSDDGRLRVRSDVRSNPAPSPVLQQLCQQLPLPVCSGSGYGQPPLALPPPELQTLLGLLGIR